MKKLQQWLGLNLLLVFTILVAAVLGVVLIDLFAQGGSAFSMEFLFDFPRNGNTEGGIWPATVGTALVTLITALFSIPLGVGAAVYLNEYAADNWVTQVIRASIRNLAGVPSIIYGLFGVAIFVNGLGMGASVLAAGMTLGLLTLPYIITTSEEALKTVPDSYREGALALGATQWQAIQTNVLPNAIPGIMTGSILGLSRAAGETAPILFTGALYYLRYLPQSVFDPFMALPYHLYILSTQHHAIEEVRPLAYGNALVLILLIFLLNIAAFILRYRFRKAQK
ncbi:MAG: phosphate ABC transporter permease PstA [Bacteroidota bacterium]